MPSECVECGAVLPLTYDYTEEVDEEDDIRRYVVAIGVIVCPECGAKYEETLGVRKR